MGIDDQVCHGLQQCLCAASKSSRLSPIMRRWQKLRSYLVWHVENLGWRKGLIAASRNLWHQVGGGRRVPEQRKPAREEQAVGLQPGELVEVKSVDEILATLDPRRRHRGLRWMTGMRKYCGHQYRVRQRVERIALESNGELRNMKNTVLLEGVMCDGRDFGGCDRSCYHFWREAWLRRVAPEAGECPAPVGAGKRGHCLSQTCTGDTT